MKGPNNQKLFKLFTDIFTQNSMIKIFYQKAFHQYTCGQHKNITNFFKDWL